MPKNLGALLSFRATGLVGGHRRGWVPPIVEEVTSHLDLTNRDQEDHPKYGPLAVANAWALLQTFPSGVVAASIGLPSSPPWANIYAQVYDALPGATVSGLMVGIGAGATPAANTTSGILGIAWARAGGSIASYGLRFSSGALSINLAMSRGCDVGVNFAGMGQSLTAGYNLYLTSPIIPFGTITTLYGLYVASQANAVAGRPLYDPTAPTSGNHSVLAATLQLFSATPSFGSGVGVLGVANAATNPTVNPVGGGIAYASAGALYWRGSGGTVTLIAAA